MGNSAEANRQTFNEWLALINQKLETHLELDEADHFCLLMPQEVEVGVALDAQVGHYYIYAPLLELDGKQDIPVLSEALRLNLHQKSTLGGTIGLDDEAGVLLFSFMQPLERSTPTLLASQLNKLPPLVSDLRSQLKKARDPSYQLKPEELNELEYENDKEVPEGIGESQTTPQMRDFA